MAPALDPHAGRGRARTWREPTAAFDYLPEIEPGADDVVVRKQHYSSFFETELDALLRARGIRDLFVAGFDARICVSATATDALARDYRVFVLRDAIATTEAPSGDGALDGGRPLPRGLRRLQR